MNICLISSEYPTDDHKGGIATYTEKTARALTGLGQDVSVITESPDGESTQVEDGISIVRLAAPRLGPPLVARAHAVARAIHRLPLPPDIVQACEYRAEGFWYASRKHPRTRLVTRLATPSFLVEKLNGEAQDHGTRSRIIERLERWQTRQSDAIISPTNALADIVCRRWSVPRQRVTTIRTGVDFAQRFASQAGDLPAELRGKDYLLYFGRLEERKGVHILAQALPWVLAMHPHLHVAFVGEAQRYRGQSLQTFVEQCNEAHRDRLHFFPRVEQHRLFSLLSHALFAVLPSLWENLANTCVEALDMGKPVVATLGCGFGEVIEDGRSGLLVPPGDVPALGQAILTLLADRHRLSHMARAAKARAGCFSLEEVTRELLGFYEALHGESRGHSSRRRPLMYTEPRNS